MEEVWPMWAWPEGGRTRYGGAGRGRGAAVHLVHRGRWGGATGGHGNRGHLQRIWNNRQLINVCNILDTCRLQTKCELYYLYFQREYIILLTALVCGRERSGPFGIQFLVNGLLGDDLDWVAACVAIVRHYYTLVAYGVTRFPYLCICCHGYHRVAAGNSHRIGAHLGTTVVGLCQSGWRFVFRNNIVIWVTSRYPQQMW